MNPLSDYEQKLIEITQNRVHNYQLTHEAWFDYVLFTPMWWLLIAITIFPWIVWYYLKPKLEYARLLYGTFFVIVIASIMDYIGIATGAWYYRYPLAPFTPECIPWDITVVPVSLLFFLQVKKGVHPFLKAVIWGGGAAFIGEPFLEWIAFYQPLKWNSFYSFFIYVALYMTAHFFAFKNSGFEKCEVHPQR
ncbi:CBO0543 family protein [Bacillus sp. 2205SS5-2]|uniref:CBO0543 family protein n=1 Tax=Bacillus sp. 2205SS5-2 TaxID=3109031 RepID=UPI00300506C5